MMQALQYCRARTESPSLRAGDAQVLKKPKAENGVDVKTGAAPAGEPDPAAGKAAAAPGSIPAFLQAGQERTPGF